MQAPFEVEQFQAAWDDAYRSAAAEARLSPLQAACYFLHLHGLAPYQIADRIFGALSPRGNTLSSRKNFWRKNRRRMDDVTKALGIAQSRLGDTFASAASASGREFQRNVLDGLRNDGSQWAALPGTPGLEFSSDRDRLPSARVMVVADLPRLRQTDRTRAYIQNLALGIEEPAPAY